MNTPSLADIAAVTRNEDGFGGGNGWWVLIILFAIFGGWGNNGGYGGSNGVGAEVQRGFDTQAIISKLDGINSGLSSLGYDQLSQMNNINTNVMQTGFGLQRDIESVSREVSDCCCKTQTGQMQILNQMGTDTCTIVTAINQAAQNIMQNDNNNYQRLHDENVAAQLAAKDAIIAEQAQKLNNCDRDASNAAQTRDLLQQVFGCFGGYLNAYQQRGNCPCQYGWQ